MDTLKDTIYPTLLTIDNLRDSTAALMKNVQEVDRWLEVLENELENVLISEDYP